MGSALAGSLTFHFEGGSGSLTQIVLTDTNQNETDIPIPNNTQTMRVPTIPTSDYSVAVGPKSDITYQCSVSPPTHYSRISPDNDYNAVVNSNTCTITKK